MADPKKLQPGQTKIGTLAAKDENGMVKEYTICYGNIAFPQRNGKYMHLRNEKYREMLTKFLDSDEGLNYESPTEEEIEKARIAVLNREAILKKKQEEKEREEAEKKAREQLDAIKQMPADTYQEPEEEDEPDEVEDKYPERTSQRGGTSIPVIILLVLNLLLTGFMLFRSLMGTGTGRGGGNVSLTVGDDTFVVPTSSIPKDGETTVTFYGISTTNNNGQVSRQAVPVGEIKVGG